MIEFVRNKETGILEVWKNGIKIGIITTMGDKIREVHQNEKKKKELKYFLEDGKEYPLKVKDGKLILPEIRKHDYS